MVGRADGDVECRQDRPALTCKLRTYGDRLYAYDDGGKEDAYRIIDVFTSSNIQWITFLNDVILCELEDDRAGGKWFLCW